MPFQIKDFASIVLAEINHARAVTTKITDFQPGSVARTLMEAPAVEIEELYMQFLLGLRDAIPVATFLSFGFEKLPAARAAGFVSISSILSRPDPILIPVGSKFYAEDGRVYESVEAVVWPAGTAPVSVQVVHTAAGLVGNVAAGVINRADLFGDGYTVSNQPITSGRDLESDAEREARFADFVRSLSRGTVVACLYAAKSAQVLDASGNVTEYVTRAGIVEEPGWVRIYTYSNLGVPSAALLLDGQRRLDGSRDDEAGTITPGYRSAGVRVDMLPMSERAVPFSASVAMFSGYDFTPAVSQRLHDLAADAISNVQPGQTLYLGTLIEQLLSAPGVRAVVPATNENIVCAENEALVPGTFTFTQLA